MQSPLDLSPAALAFGAEVRRFFESALEDDVRRVVAESGDVIPIDLQKRWHRTLHARGWGGHGLPVDAGGTGWDDECYYVFLRENALADAPRPMMYGLRFLAAALGKYGTPVQKAKYLPGIVSGETFWCQTFSEPNAGSDLASLRCRAVRDGNDYVVTGTKIWTTEAHWADGLFGLFRTSSGATKQEGITVLLTELPRDGITVRPLRSLDGSHEVNEVVFDDARIPVANRIGDEGDGWKIAKYLLGGERLELAEVGRCWALLGKIKLLLARDDAHSRALRDEAATLLQLADLEIRLVALDASERLMLKAGGAAQQAGAPALKIAGTTLAQDLAEFFADLCGVAAQVVHHPPGSVAAPPLGPDEARYACLLYYAMRPRTVYGGSTETMRNLIAREDFGADAK